MRFEHVAGWIAIAFSTVIAAFWAFWGSIENFHEGWYYREWWRNVGLALIQDLPWMFVPIAGALAALWRRWIGVAAHIAMALGALQLFGYRWPVGAALIAAPMVLLAILYGVGRPRPAPAGRRRVVVRRAAPMRPACR